MVPMISIHRISPKSEYWNQLIEFAHACPWVAGPQLADQMRSHAFNEWESIFVALSESQIVGFCTLTRQDCFNDVPYTPFIGFIYVNEAARGQRISLQLIQTAMAYANDLGFSKVYIASTHIGLYEKLGFTRIDERTDIWGQWEQIFMQKTLVLHA